MKSNYSRKNSVGAISSTSLSKHKNHVKMLKKRNELSLDGAAANPALNDDNILKNSHD